jgi:O-antigen chain-terminating methyltransferase
MQSSNSPALDPDKTSLTLKQRIRRLPLIGPFLAWTYAILRINPNRRHILVELAKLQELQQTHHVQVSQRLDRLDTLNIEGRLDTLEGVQSALRIAQLESANAANRIAALEQALAAMRTANAARDNRVAALTQEVHRSARASIAATAPVWPEVVAPPPTPAGFDMDSFYVEFEGMFRGTREDIQNRLKVYLPYVAPMSGDGSARVVDIGCGRGEWLELLSQQGIKALGIDLNSDMVETCRERGLQAECGDAVAWLRAQPEGSLAAVTGFHIIEHLPFETLIALFDAALHALRPDGFVIFETPNPENVSVGSCNFYYDPTHRHPLVPVVIDFMARQRGFVRAEILRLHPYPEELQVKEDSEAARRINKLFYGPQDFAVMAWKSNPAAAIDAQPK